MDEMPPVAGVGAGAGSADLIALLDESRSVREVEPGIFSVMPEDLPGQVYDSRARAYDRMIGNRLYNRLLWGTSPDAYRRFAAEAVDSSDSGWLLDAGCGTMLFTAELYARTLRRPVVAVDLSLGMLRAGKARLDAAAQGSEHRVILLQADLLDLPFLPGVFGTVLSMGMLHLFDEAAPVVAGLGRCLRPGGRMYLTSLVETGRLGDRYLRFLHRTGEVASPRDIKRLRAELVQGKLKEPHVRLDGNMAFVTAENVPSAIDGHQLEADVRRVVS